MRIRAANSAIRNIFIIFTYGIMFFCYDKSSKIRQNQLPFYYRVLYNQFCIFDINLFALKS